MFYQSTQIDLDRLRKYKEKLLLSADKNIKEIHNIGTCCIQQADYPPSFQQSTFYDSTLGQRIRSRLEGFDKSEFTRLNPQSAVLPSLTLGLKDCSLEEPSDYTICKYDLNFAYLQSILHEGGYQSRMKWVFKNHFERVRSL